MCIQRSGLASQNANRNINPGAAPIRKWINTCAHRKHTRDVRALFISHKMAMGHKMKMKLFVSKSIDTGLCKPLRLPVKNTIVGDDYYVG